MDLKKINRQRDFSARDIACLIGGRDPDHTTSDVDINRDFETVRIAFDEANSYLVHKAPLADFSNIDGSPLFSTQLVRFFKHKLKVYEDAIRVDGKLRFLDRSELRSFTTDINKWQTHADSKIENNTFDRSEVVRWLKTCDFESEYIFDLTAPQTDADPTRPQKIGPNDFSDEHYSANLAFAALRAFANSNVKMPSTEKNWLIDYLKTTYPMYKPSQIDRIATLVNRDKDTGRKIPK